HQEKCEAQSQRKKFTHGNAKLAKAFRDLQRNYEQRQRQSKNHVAEHVQARNACAAHAEAVLNPLFRMREGHRFFENSPQRTGTSPVLGFAPALASKFNTDETNSLSVIPM